MVDQSIFLKEMKNQTPTNAGVMPLPINKILIAFSLSVPDYMLAAYLYHILAPIMMSGLLISSHLPYLERWGNGVKRG